MIDLNSLSKEELIKLVTQKEEQLRAAEDLAEKRERSNIKFDSRRYIAGASPQRRQRQLTSLKWKST